MCKDIVLICDDAYALPTYVCVKSITESIKDCDGIEISIHICTLGLGDDNVKSFLKLATANCRIDVSFFNDFIKNKTLHIVQKTHVTPSALVKFELPNFFCDIDSVLYLDSDIVIKENLQDLLRYDLSNNYLAASYEFYKYLDEVAYKPKSKIDRSFYFNSGVMLMNLKKMREDGITEQLWDYKLNRAKTSLMDQESFNEICGNFTVHLPICWNFNPVFFSQEYLKDINIMYGQKYTSLKELINDIKIIHYVGKTEKPWKYSSAKFENYWMNYYQLIDYKCELKRISYVPPHRNLATRIFEKFKAYGFSGFAYFFMHRLKKDWRN